MSKKTEAVVAEAMARSKEIFDAIPENKIADRVNSERIIEVCKALVNAKPSVEPRTPAVSERGKILYGKFPAEQSLLNRYGHLLRIWREAFAKLVNASAPTTKDTSQSLFPDDDELAALDHGTRARVMMMRAALREKTL